MFPISTPSYLQSVVRVAGVLKKEQLLRFFSDADDALKVEYYIRTLVTDRTFDYDEKTDTISWHNQVPESNDTRKRRIQAFWVITSFRSKMIRAIHPMAYPHQFIFITNDNMSYDIAVCNSKMDAMQAMRIRMLNTIKDVEDDCNHIVVVPSVDVGEQLGQYGFDSYCVLDSNFNVRYGQWV